MTQSTLTRRDFCHSTVSVAVAAALGCRSQPFTKEFRLRYMVASCMYGGLSLETIVPEVRKSGATHIDVWSSHGKPKTQHEMMTANPPRPTLVLEPWVFVPSALLPPSLKTTARDPR